MRGWANELMGGEVEPFTNSRGRNYERQIQRPKGRVPDRDPNNQGKVQKKGPAGKKNGPASSKARPARGGKSQKKNLAIEKILAEKGSEKRRRRLSFAGGGGAYVGKGG